MLQKGLLKEYAQVLSLILRGLDVVAIVAAGLAAYYYKSGNLQLPKQYVSGLFIAAMMTLVVFQYFKMYESNRAIGFWSYIRHLMRAIGAVLILLACLAFLTKTGEDFSRKWFALWTVFSFGLLILLRCGILVVLRIMRTYGWNERQVVIIGTRELSIKLIKTMYDAHWTGFRVVAVFEDEIIDRAPIFNIPVFQTPKYISAYFAEKKQTIDEIWLAYPLRAEKRVKEILHDMRHETITIRFILDIIGLDLFHHSIAEFAGFPMVNIRHTPMVGMNRLVKAVEDRILASMILLFISPLLGLIAIAVKLSSQGPVFYRQKRVSWNGREFEMLKFRTMPVDIEKQTGPVWAKAGENRATTIGAFLRKTSLDELPQFINVLRGDMSIVGPRPERLIFVEQFKDQIPRYMQKHLVKAGITGWAQINGWRGNTSLEKRIEYDLYYIEHWSLFFDLKIIFLTFIQGLLHKNAY